MKTTSTHSQFSVGPISLHLRSSRIACALVGLVLCWLATGSAQAVGSITTPLPTYTFIDHSGLWYEQTPYTLLTIDSNRTDFLAQIELQAANGLRLAAFETWETRGSRHYAGLFRVGNTQRRLFFDLDAALFENRRQQQALIGEMLLDVEVQIVDGERRYSGLWGPGIAFEIMLDNLPAATFEASVNYYSATHELALFETWKTNGDVFAYGILRPAIIEDVVLIDGNEDDFFTAVRNYGEAGYQLVDFDIASYNHFSARWVLSSPKQSDWLGIFYTHADLLGANAMLSAGVGDSGIGFDLNTYVLPTGVPMPLLDLEVTTSTLPGTIIQAKPISDTGTPGPPRG